MILSEQLERAICEQTAWKPYNIVNFSPEGYEATTPMGRATLTKNAKKVWFLNVAGKSVELGKKADFPKAEAALKKLRA